MIGGPRSLSDGCEAKVWARTGAEKMACLRLLKPECVFDFSRRDFERSSLVVDIGIVPRGQN